MLSTAVSLVDPLRILLRRKSELRIASKIVAAVVESIESEHTIFQFVCLSVFRISSLRSISIGCPYVQCFVLLFQE